MKGLTLLFKNTFKIQHIIYFLIGCTTVLTKTMLKWQLSLILFGILAVLILLDKYTRIGFIKKLDLQQIKWILGPLVIYSLILPQKVVGLLMIAHFYSDRIAYITRNTCSPYYNKLFPKNLVGTLFFILSNFILSLAFTYYFNGFLLKKYIMVFFINSIFLGLMENSHRINKLPDNFNINIFGSVFITLSLLIDFKLRISSINIVFGFLMCFIFCILLILFDIIKLKSIYKYYLAFLIYYASYGSDLFLFHIIILVSIGIIKKIYLYYNKQMHYFSTFIEIDEIKDSFLLSLILVFIYSIIPYSYLYLIKPSLVISLIITLLYYFYEQLNPYIPKKVITIKNLKLPQETIIYSIIITAGLLCISYFINIINLKTVLYAFLYISIINITYITLKTMKIHILENPYSKFLLIYFSFKIYFLIQLL